VTEVLEDSWREAGFGFGHTFPGAQNEWSSRPAIAGWDVPQWLVRIDYVFHSTHFDTLAVRTAQFDGMSDHRGVVASLALAPAGQPGTAE
jgi:endonuclease/exonuclease/phosphatase family metal-dependent hydrolase